MYKLVLDRNAIKFIGVVMKKKKESKFNNRYEVIDAFRFFFFLVIAIFGMSFLYTVLLNIIASAKGVDYETLATTETAQVISYLITPVTLIVYFITYNSIRKVRCKEAFGDGQKISLLPISVAIVLAIIAIFLFTPLMNMIDYFFEGQGYLVDDTIPMQDKMSSSIGYFGLGLLIYALLPAIAEEIVFRGVIQRSLLSKYTGFVAIFFSTLLFVLLHGALQQTLYQMVVGIMLGYLACVGGSILYSIILHFLNNALVLVFGCFDIVAYLAPSNTVYYNIFSLVFPICIFLLGIALVGILFWVMKYLRNNNFFRYETKTAKKLRQEKERELAAVKKLTIKDMWKNMQYSEKIFMIMSVALMGIIWIVNTISGFIG